MQKVLDNTQGDLDANLYIYIFKNLLFEKSENPSVLDTYDNFKKGKQLQATNHRINFPPRKFSTNFFFNIFNIQYRTTPSDLLPRAIPRGPRGASKNV